MRLLPAVIVSLVVFLAAPFSAVAGQFYSVVNVDASDTLNVRTGVDAGGSLKDTTIIGALPPDATGVEATGKSLQFQGRIWREIRFKGDIGWVADRFLRSDGLPEEPGNIQCGGTEPFWDLSVQGDNAVYSTPEDDRTLEIVSVRKGANRRDVWSIRMLSGGGTAVAGLLVYTDQCSDGMSDFNYAFDIYLTGAREGSGPLQGCCTFR